MDPNTAIAVKDLSKTFRLPHEKNSSIKSAFINFYSRKRTFELQQALKDISFEVKKGEFFGIVGRNGSGKSTLLKLLAGIYTPTSGSIQINGSLTPFIELGVGFNPELTGRENVFLNGALLGFDRKQMQSMYKDIVEFAELGRFMDQKLKNYSTGMEVRLAFSIAIRAKSDILLIDEVLAVGDAAFQQKCFDYFRELKSINKTVVFVSHDRSALESFCSRCLLIDDGVAVDLAETSKILGRYNQITLDNMAEVKPTESKSRWGTREMEIISADFEGGTSKFSPKDTIKLKVDMLANKDIDEPVYGIIIKKSDGQEVFVTNTKVEKINTGKIEAKTKLSVTYEIDNIFGNGKYVISPAIANQDTNVFFDWREGLIEFVVSGWDNNFAPIHPKHKIMIQKAKT